MKRITLTLALMLISYLGFSQALSETGNWPNANWTISGSYDATFLYSDPTTTSNFSFDDDDAGGSSINSIAAESPTIDLTAAYNAGETWIYIQADMVFTFYTGGNNFIYFQYFDADANTWVNAVNPIGESTTSAPYLDYCTGTFETTLSDPINIAGFTATQLSGFKYRLLFDDGTDYAYGFCFENPLVYSETPPTCPDPTMLAVNNITNATADFSWIENGSAAGWNIQYGESPYTLDSGSTNSATNNPYNVTGLTGNTTYDIYVQSDCGSETSAWIGPITFTTACNAITAPYTEGFDNGGDLPTCWNHGASNSEDWIITSSTLGTHIGYEGTLSGNTDTDGYFAYVEDSYPESSNTALLTPFIDVTGLTTPSVSFYMISDNEGYTNVDFSVDFYDGATWHNGVYTSNSNKTQWTKIYIDLSTYTLSGNVQVRFVVSETNGSDYYDDVAIDDITFDELPSCIEPTDVEISSISYDSAQITLQQTGGSNGWDIEYGTPGFTQGTGTTVSASSMPYTIATLTENTDYEFYIQTNCGAGDTSTWIGPYTFTTLCSPFTAPYTEDFENAGAIPNCWLQGEDNDEDWLFDTTASIGPGASASGGYFAYVSDTYPENTDTSILSPLVDISTLTTPALTFWYNTNNTALGANGFTVDIFDGTTWNTSVFTSNTDTLGWTYIAVDLTGYTGPVRARFRVTEVNYTTANDIAIDDVTFEEYPDCLPATDLETTNITASSVDLSWTATGTPEGFTIEYGPEGFTPGTGATTTATTTTATVNGLDAATEYDFYVATNCDIATGTNSVLAGPLTATTECSVYPSPYIETFNNGGVIPNCWEQSASNTEDWYFTNTAAGNHIGNDGTLTGSTTSGGYFAYVDDSSPESANTGLETPLVDVSGLATPALIFYMASDNEGYTNVDFSVDFFDGASWNTGIYTSNANTNGWTLVTIDLSAYTITGPVQARFVVSETNGTDFYDDVAIDDVMFDEMPSCTIPTDLTVSNITTYGADFSWVENGSATSWNIEYGLEGFTPGTGAVIPATSNPTTVEEFTYATTYDIYIQADCGSSTSLWVGPLTFTTLCLPFGDFVESFDTTTTGETPLCWSILENTTDQYAYTQVESWNPNSSPNNISMYNSGDINSDLLLITPALTDLPNGTHRAKFYAQGSAWSTISIEVGTMSDNTDPSTFTSVATFDLTGDYLQYIVDFDTPTTDSYVAIKHGSTATYQTLYVDDFEWTAIPTTAPGCATNVVATPDASCGNFANQITWDATADADGYYISVGTTPGATDVVNNEDLGNSNFYAFEGSYDTTYYYTVSPYNASGTATGCTEYSFTTVATGCYCTSNPISVDNQGITQVVIGSSTYDNTVGGPNTYNDFTATPATLASGVLSTIPITYDTFTYQYATGIWIDLNDNYTFEDSEKLFSGMSANYSPNTLMAQIQLPAGTTGQHVMRINGVWNGTENQCYNGSYGVTLDFVVDITAATCTAPTIAGTSVVHDCATGTFSVDVDVTDLGDSTPSISDGTNTWTVNATGITNVGPFTYGTPVSLTALHGNDSVCDLPIGSFSYDACPPSNDDLCNATALTVLDLGSANTTPGDAYTTEFSTSQVNEPTPSCFNGGLNGSVWFSFVAPQSGDVMVTTDITGGTSGDTEIAVYSANGVNCGNMTTLGTELACNQDAFGDVAFNSIIYFDGSANALLTPGEMYYIQVDSYGNSSIGSFGIEVIDMNPAKTDDFNSNVFTYYPNPVKNNNLTLNSQEVINTVNVFNLLGQRVMTLTPNTSNYTINMSELKSGTYFVEVQTENASETVKIIKE
ncbi:fibronectin type III domain-containing protein [Neptunitalea lumnitzerae]|uniref:T9SS type A sorting domain-containing protein n=1 Tax=Neptunitalea lumnitzerae TaxID=2965509 RepID=A0ABQ5MH97_9FLAO|nr:fibronectin type III domain-containing protein [Neptunitalea sp. Y10]GLB48779.1 hypothetical protein Y10_11470 [Neptunitalea sp. Y10]